MKKGCSIPMKATIFFAIPVLILVYWGCEFSFSTARLSDAVMCSGVDEQTKKPLQKTDAFTTETSEIFCSVKLSNAPSETKIKSEWIYVKGEVEDLSEYIIDEFSLTAEGTTYIAFSLTKPNTGFPRGDYLLKLYLEDEEKISVSFKVE